MEAVSASESPTIAPLSEQHGSAVPAPTQTIDRHARAPLCCALGNRVRQPCPQVLHMMGREDPTGDVEQFLHNQHYPYDFDDPQILRGIQQGRF